MLKRYTLAAALLLSVSLWAQTTRYTVKKGDNPTTIAQKFNLSVEELMRLNPKAKADNLKIGESLVVKGGKGQESDEMPVAPRNIQPDLGYIIIKPKQTIYGITRQYKVSEAELRRLNPNLGDGLKIGEKINLPVNSIKKFADADSQNSAYQVEANTAAMPNVAAASTAPVAPQQEYATTAVSADNYITYTVQEGDTLFGIVNKFGTSLETLTTLNPDLSKGLQPGMSVKLRKADKAFVKKSGDVLNVVLLLPFGFDGAEDKYRNMSLDFLTGAKIAIERYAGLGHKLNVNIIDAGNESSFKKALTQINRDNTDLIVGPFFKSNVLETLEYVKDSGIPIVSPTANSEDLYDYGNLVIVETGERFYADRIAEEVKKAYNSQKIFIVGPKDENTAYLQNQIQQKVSKAEVVIVSSADQIQSDKNMATGQPAPVIGVLASEDSAAATAFAERMLALSKTTSGMRAFSLGYAPVFEKKADALGAVNLVYLMDRKIDTSGAEERSILADYKEKYCKTPGKFAVVGFDVVYDMLTRENSRGELLKNMAREQTHLATKFSYRRVKPNGAFVNTGFRVISLTQ